MTAKEKAEDLFNKMDMIIYTDSDWKSQCKRCALIAVDEIINAIDWHEFETPNELLNYYQQVKTEINKL